MEIQCAFVAPLESYIHYSTNYSPINISETRDKVSTILNAWWAESTFAFGL